MVKVFFDHQKFTTQLYGGISRYFANIIQEIKSDDEFDYKLGVLYCKNHYIKDEHQPLNNIVGKSIQKIRPNYLYDINQAYCKRLLKKNDFDIFHPTYYDPYFLSDLKKPLVITMHDLTYERMPEYFWAQDPLTQQKRLNLERADAIIAISETTKTDLLKYYDVDASKVSVVYHGIEIDTALNVATVPNLPKDYLLFVGDRSGYKNFYRFINAYDVLSKRYPGLHVILTGGGAMGTADVELLHRLQLSDKVKHINATDEQLNYLYKNALLFVYPSLNEGFGLPVLEAFKAECPMILSDTDCFREIAQDAAVYFAPYQEEDLISVLDNAINDSTLRTSLKQKGLERLQDFPLNKSVEETLDVYRKLKP